MSNEAPLAASGSVVATTVTDANGLYEFDSKQTALLPSTAYTVEVLAEQSALEYERFMTAKPLQPSAPMQGGDDALDSNGVPRAIPGNSLTRDSIASVTSPLTLAAI